VPLGLENKRRKILIGEASEGVFNRPLNVEGKSTSITTNAKNMLTKAHRAITTPESEETRKTFFVQERPARRNQYSNGLSTNGQGTDCDYSVLPEPEPERNP